MGRKYHLMFVPDDGGQVRSLRVSTRWVPAVIAGVVVSAILVTFTSVSFFQARRMHSKNAEVQAENSGLRAHLQSVSGRLDEALAEVQRNEEMEQEARLLAGLDPLDEQTRQLGVGGPLSPAPTFTSDPGVRADLVGQFHRLDELERRVAFQAASYQEALGLLGSNRERIDHTPTVEPLGGPYAVSSLYGWREDPFTGSEVYHYGVDFRAPFGTPIRATADGVVNTVGYRGDYGLTVTIDHGDGVETMYAHLDSASCQEGDRVKRGDTVAALGTSGRSTGPHVHYEVRVNGVAQNPRRYIVNREFDAR